MNQETRKTHILVVDDDPVARLLARETLESAGWLVSEASDGESAIETFGMVGADVILLDVMMPGLSGHATCATIRRTKKGADVPILMVTGLDDVDAVEQAYRVGATDFVMKPVNYTILRQRVEYMVRAHRNLEELRKKEQRLRFAQELARMGDWEVQVSSGAVSLSDAAAGLLGLPPQPTVTRLSALLKYVHRSDRLRVCRTVAKAIRSRTPFVLEHRVAIASLQERVLYHEGVPLRDGLTFVGTLQDVSERRASEARIAHLAYYDNVTSLPNRAFLVRHLHHVVERAKRESNPLSVLAFDIDGFKQLNDTEGHSMGDGALAEVGRRIERAIQAFGRPDHKMHHTVARFGSDEFVAILYGADAEEAERFVTGVLESIAEPMALHGSSVVMTACAGVCVVGDEGDAESALRHADLAMHEARGAGRSSYRFHSEAIRERSQANLRIEAGLRAALTRGELEVHFQPKVSSVSGETVGAEALMRWRNGETGLVSPADFIPVAEDTGLIVPMGEWILRAACEHVVQWSRSGYERVSVSVNLSARQFQQGRIVETVSRVLRETGVSPSLLELEVTEGAMMADTEANLAILADLKKLGLRIALDDFGTGYSSLSYLRKFPIDTLKIDRSFVRHVTEDPDARAITMAIIAMAKQLRMHLVAEGVETEAQLHFLKAQGCHEIQGFLYSPPLAPERFRTWLDARAAIEEERVSGECPVAPRTASMSA